MKFIKLATYIIIAVAASMPAMAQSPKSNAHTAHSAAHKQLLANHKNTLDRSVVSRLVEQDVIAREEGDHLSKESLGMLSDILKEANKHIGKRYVHGAKGPSAFDCSGFSSYVYKQFGYNLSPSSRTQYTQGVAVDRKHLRQGDLVFFTSRSSRGAVGHVGIVVSANNETGDFKFIHASIKGVKIDHCQGYYEGRYIGARRIVTE